MAEHHPVLFTGTSHPALAEKVASHLGIKLGERIVEAFPDQEIFVDILESVRGKEVFLLQSVVGRPNYYLMELLTMIDALKRAAAGRIVVVLPYFGYARQDRRNGERVPITARLVANLLEAAGADQVLTIDLHAEQIQGFFNIPVDNLVAREVLIKGMEGEGSVVASPDVGSIKIAREVAALLGCGFVTVDKRRLSPKEVEVTTLIGDVREKDVLLVDDICSTGGTMVAAAEACMKAGCRRVIGLVTHGLLVEDAVKRIEESCIERLIVTDTIPGVEAKSEKIESVSIAHLLGEAISRISSARSVMELFR